MGWNRSGAQGVARLLAVAGLIVASLLAPAVAAAQTWVVTVGVRGTAYPPYEGADHDVFAPSPTFNIRRVDSPNRFKPPDGGSSLALIATRYFEAGPLVRFRLDRGDGGKLEGLTPIKWAIEPGAFAEFWPVNFFRLRVEGRHGFNGYDGWVGDAGADLIYTGPRWSASIGPRVGWGDARYMDTYFGVTPQEALSSPFINGAYEPGAGRRYTGLEAAIARHLTRRWTVGADFGWRRLSKLVANSPVVEVAGSDNDFSGGVGVSFSFGLGHARSR